MTQSKTSMQLNLPSEHDMDENEPKSLAEATTKALPEGELCDTVANESHNKQVYPNNQSVDKAAFSLSDDANVTITGTGIGDIPAGDIDKSNKSDDGDGGLACNSKQAI